MSNAVMRPCVACARDNCPYFPCNINQIYINTFNCKGLHMDCHAVVSVMSPFVPPVNPRPTGGSPQTPRRISPRQIFLAFFSSLREALGLHWLPCCFPRRQYTGMLFLGQQCHIFYWHTPGMAESSALFPQPTSSELPCATTPPRCRPLLSPQTSRKPPGTQREGSRGLWYP